MRIELLPVILGALVALAGAVRRLPAAWSAYCVVALALPLSWPAEGQPLMSLPRFLAVLWPLHVWLAVVLAGPGRALARRVVLALWAVGLAGASALFATWHWVA